MTEEDAKMLEEVVRRSIVVLGNAGVEQHIPRVGVPVSSGEWIGSRAKVMGEKEDEERDGWSEEKKYRSMMEEVEAGEDANVILLLHGGMFQMSLIFFIFFCPKGGFFSTIIVIIIVVVVIIIASENKL